MWNNANVILDAAHEYFRAKDKLDKAREGIERAGAFHFDEQDEVDRCASNFGEALNFYVETQFDRLMEKLERNRPNS